MIISIFEMYDTSIGLNVEIKSKGYDLSRTNSSLRST